MSRYVIKFLSILFIGLILIIFENQASAFVKFDVGAERFYDGVKHNSYQLKVSALSYEYNPEYNSTTYKFKAWGQNDTNSSDILATVYSDGYVKMVMVGYDLNINSPNGQATFDKSLGACLDPLGITYREQAWLSSHWTAEIPSNETVPYMTEVIRDNGVLLRIRMVYLIQKARIVGMIVQL